MRVCYIFIVVLATAFTRGSSMIQSGTKIAKTPNKEIFGSSKRSLRRYNMDDLDHNNEERMIKLDLKNIEEVLGTAELDLAFHSNRIDEIFSGLENGKALGKIDKSTLDSVRSSGDNPSYFNKVFAEWKNNGISPTELTKFIESNQ
ncbi:RxLR effector protein, partial [Phytophthora megakarya]